MENLYPKHGIVSRTYSKKSLIMALIFGSKSKSFTIMSTAPLRRALTTQQAGGLENYGQTKHGILSKG
ncbi:hypothetical protein Tco_0868807 [Tanacetum coccineum]